MLVHDMVTGQCESEVSCSELQRNGPGQDLKPDHLTGLQCTVPLGWDVNEEQINNTFLLENSHFLSWKKRHAYPYTLH